MTDDSGDYEEEYQSGPFCRHWGDPSDCEETCATCGHRCGLHLDDGCVETGCTCAAWVEED